MRWMSRHSALSGPGGSGARGRGAEAVRGGVIKKGRSRKYKLTRKYPDCYRFLEVYGPGFFFLVTALILKVEKPRAASAMLTALSQVYELSPTVSLLIRTF